MHAVRPSRFLALLATLAVLWGCTSDSPSGPTQPPPSNPQPPAPVTTFNVSVTANPPQIVAGTTQSSVITVNVTRSDTGAPPPDLTEVIVTTNLGTFGSAASGQQTVTLQLVNGRAQAVLFPGTDVGSATVRAQVAQSAGAANVAIIGAATFFVSSIAPGVGDPNGGQTVDIVGGGFDGPVRVTFGAATAQVLSVTPSRITVRTPTATAAGIDNLPVGGSAQVDVAVTINLNETGQLTDSLPRAFTYAHGGSTQQPQIFSVTPGSGTNDGGTPMVIVGSGFQSPVQVLFGSGDVTNFNGVEAILDSVTPNQIVLRSPPARGFGQNNVNQLVSLLVRNLNTGFFTIRTGAFKYGSNVLITAIGPTVGPASGGTLVTISGQGFDEPVAVSIGGIGQTVISVTGTEVVIRTSGILVTECPESGFVEAQGVSVTNIETGDSDAADITFQYQVPLPRIFGVNPFSGAVGTQVTISGVNFSSNVQVLFGGATGSAAQVLSVSPTAIVARVPTPPPGFVFDTEPCDGNGDGNPGGTRNIPTPMTIVVRNLDTAQCEATLTNAFTITPQNTTCTGDTTTPPPPPVTQCNDGFDNDGDTFVDALDPQCTGPTDNSEAT